jgi:inorganic pyrophosphatase
MLGLALLYPQERTSRAFRDSLALSQVPVTSGAVIRCRPIRALLMEDEHGVDEKILTVPVDDLNPYYDLVESYTDLPAIMRNQIEHFFRHKDLAKDKWIKGLRWVVREDPYDLIRRAISLFHTT